MTRRKLIPALFNLYLDKSLPERFAIIGLDRVAELNDETFRQNLHESVNQFSRRGPASASDWNPFAARLSYLRADFTDQALYAKLAELLAKQDHEWNAKADRSLVHGDAQQEHIGLGRKIRPLSASRDESDFLMKAQPDGNNRNFSCPEWVRHGEWIFIQYAANDRHGMCAQNINGDGGVQQVGIVSADHRIVIARQNLIFGLNHEICDSTRLQFWT